MSSFRFRLDRVRNVRAIEEEVSRGRWQEAEALARRARDEAERSQSEIRSACAELAALVGGGPVEPAQVLWRQGILNHLRQRLEGANARANELEREAEARRAAWQEKKQGVEGLSRLEERQGAEHAIEEERRANAGLDEVAQRRARERRLKDVPPALPDSPDATCAAERDADKDLTDS
jgi:flagellar export protein FliJ